MNQHIQSGKKLFTFFGLYIAQTIPMSFFSTVLPVIMRQQDFSLQAIGMLQFIKLPWILKFIWSPVVDRTSHNLTHFKRWIFTSELVYAVLILSVSFLNLKTDFQVILPLVILAFIASATQDIATDALAVLSFDKKNKSMVNSMQSLGSFGGAMIGGGVLLLLYHSLGWNQLLPYLAVFVAIALIPLVFFKEKDVDQPIESKNNSAVSFDDWLGFFKQKGIWKQVIFLFIYFAGLIGILSMLKPMLVDYGYNMKQIGVMSGVIGSSIGCLGSLLGGFIVRKIGCFIPRIIFAVMILLSAIYFYLLVTRLDVNIATLHFGISLLWLSYGLGTIVVYTTSMECVRKGFEGTDFTLQTVITHISGMIMAVGAGKLADVLGYDSLFLVEIAIAAVSLLYILSAFRNLKNDGKSTDR